VQPPLTEADQRSLELQAKEEQRRPEQKVDVSFEQEPMSEGEYIDLTEDDGRSGDEAGDGDRARPSALPGHASSAAGEGPGAEVARGDPGAPSDEAPADDLSTLTKAELYERARQMGIPGRSQMTREELIEAVGPRR
jgi:DNA end-binding protein Ku